MSNNNARQQAARGIQAANPGMPYQTAWEIAGLAHLEAKALLAARPYETYASVWDGAVALVRLRRSYAHWEAIFAAEDQRADNYAYTTQPRFHPHVAVRLHGYGRPVQVEITPAYFDECSPHQLADAITDVAQRSWDAALSSTPYGLQPGPDPQLTDEYPLFSESSPDDALTVAADRRGRVVRCQIAHWADKAPWWSAAALADRILHLMVLAVMRSERDIHRQICSHFEPLSDRPCGCETNSTLKAATDAEIAEYRAIHAGIGA